jgi:hypothetical protein
MTGLGRLVEHSFGLDSEDPRLAVERAVRQFAAAWFLGDCGAMLQCFHPDYLNRVASIDGRGEPARDLLRSAVGIQGQFGRMTPPDRRQQEVRVLDVRTNSASAVAIMGDWVLQIHLARTGGQWAIVNALWESNG